MTSDGSPLSRFYRAIDRRNLWGAEDAARELRHLSLEDARQLVDLYAEAGSQKFDRAAVRWLSRYGAEKEPGLDEFYRVTLDLKRQAH